MACRALGVDTGRQEGRCSSSICWACRTSHSTECPCSSAGRGSLALLAYLALSRRAHPRESLATLLAGECSEARSRKLLSNVLVDLHRAVGDYIVVSRNALAFDHDRPHWLDVDVFRSRLMTTLEGSSSGDLNEAIALYRDELLAGRPPVRCARAGVVVVQRSGGLRGLYVQALRREVESGKDERPLTVGIPLARRLLAEEPWLEEAHRDLMSMLARAGQRHAAIAQYHACRKVLREELGTDPQPETTALFNRLRTDNTPVPHNVPLPTTPMVGRAEQLRLLVPVLSDPECRLMTITGLGGAGKTRLAMEVARRLALPNTQSTEHPFPDGVVFVALADDPEASMRSELLDLESQTRLLVLDNVDELQSETHVVTDLLARAPHVTVLATSRSPLHLPGERVLRLDGLALPRSEDELEDAEASALFLQEARRVEVGFQLACEDRPFLVQLCQAVGGLPLALLLAARWMPVLSCAALMDELATGVGVLSTAESDLPIRQRSIASVLDSALERLPGAERTLACGLPLPAELLRRLRELTLVSIGDDRQGAQPHPLLRPYFRSRVA